MSILACPRVIGTTLTLTCSAYIVQGHRFNIFENLGCYPAIYNTLPTYFLVYMWPILIGIISSVYCSEFLTLRADALF